MWMCYYETPTGLLRLNKHGGGEPRLQQQWDVRDSNATSGPKEWSEWRDVPIVDEPPGVKTPTSRWAPTMG